MLHYKWNPISHSFYILFIHMQIPRKNCGQLHNITAVGAAPISMYINPLGSEQSTIAHAIDGAIACTRGG